MHSLAPIALATLLAATVPAQLRAQTPTPFTVPPATTHFTDPANLAGERPNPRNGRELPIDGGLSADGQPDNALGLAQLLRKLNTRASLMLIVAHPDDEDGGMLAYYSRGLGARVAILTLNRGEGGQNQATSDFNDALGLLRTQELLAADRYMGVDTQMFGTEVDFGFSKTKAESFAKWNHQRVLYDAVRAVRIFRPLVIASVFVGAVTDGHGQHQVAGQIAQEVFKAAGDPSVFPELTREGILPWQPLKVYARVPFAPVTAHGLYDYATGQTVPAEFTNYVTGEKFTTEPTPDVTINEGATDPLLTTCAANPSDLPHSLSSRTPFPLSSRSAAKGSASPSTAFDCHPLSYVQFARIGLGLQRTQIGAGMRIPPAGPYDVGYHLYGSRVCAPNLPNPTPNLCTSSSTTAADNHETGWPTLSQSERVGYRATRENTPIGPIMLASFTTSRTPAVLASLASSKAPTARTITAQGNALGAVPNNDPRAEGPSYNPAANPALANQPTFFSGIDTSLDGLSSLAPDAPLSLRAQISNLSGKISEATRDFNPKDLSADAPALAQALHTCDALIVLLSTRQNPVDNAARDDATAPAIALPPSFTHLQRANILHELRIKRVQLNDALALSLGLSLDATAQTPDVVAHTPLTVATTITSTWLGKLYNQSQMLTTSDQRTSPGFIYADDNPGFTAAAAFNNTLKVQAKTLAQPTRPYFSRTNIEQPVYTLDNAELRNAPSTPPALTVWARIVYNATPIELGRVVHSGLQPLQIVPTASLAVQPHAQVLPNADASARFQTEISPVSDPPLKPSFSLPKGWTISPLVTDVKAEGFTFFDLHAPRKPRSPITLSAFVTPPNHQTITEGFRPVGYGNLPRTNYYTPATLRVVPVDLKLPPPNKRRIAYLPGTGDDVPAALASIGLAPTILKVSDLTPTTLAKFDTVILGVRTYNAHPDLHGAPTQALLDFARSGGNVVVQYQTPEFTAADAPYPISVARGEKVVDETAAVKLLEPKASRHPEASASGLSATSKEKGLQPLGYALLNVPNRITEADFDNWIEERGHGFPNSWDPHYTALTETHDPGAPAEHILPQAPQRGGLITVQLGRGRWTYCAFALYRQLPEAVPGAFRLFVNLLNP